MKRQRRRKRTKSENIKTHATKRIHQRLGFYPNGNDYDNMRRLIQNGRTKYLEKVSNRISKHQMTYRDKTFVVIYDKNRKMIVTVLYPEEEYKEMMDTL